MIEILSVKKKEAKKTLTLRAKENIDASRERRHSQKKIPLIAFMRQKISKKAKIFISKSEVKIE